MNIKNISPLIINIKNNKIFDQKNTSVTESLLHNSASSNKNKSKYNGFGKSLKIDQNQ